VKESTKRWLQQGQTIQLLRRGSGGDRLWAYRYRTSGRDFKRVQRGEFASEQGACEALDPELERLGQQNPATSLRVEFCVKALVNVWGRLTAKW
jgi:hypothetical protein